MEIIIKTKNLELTALLEKFIHTKMGKLEKFLHKSNEQILIEIEKETTRHAKGDIFMAEGMVQFPGKSFVAKAHGEDLMKVIGEVKDELEIEIKKYKTKTIEAPRRKIRKESQKEGF